MKFFNSFTKVGFYKVAQMSFTILKIEKNEWKRKNKFLFWLYVIYHMGMTLN